jgi:uncharacterized membrane protein
MRSRGTWETFIVALPIAFFSGLGVAVSLLDDQTSSLVGVAISASLLPPAVNSGILWIAFAFEESNIIPVFPEHADQNRGLQDAGIGNRDDDDDESVALRSYAKMGLISILITLANIILIWGSSMLMFRMKEVLPIKKSVFWEDLGVARKVYQRRALLQTSTMLNDSAYTEDNAVLEDDQ